MLLNLFLIFSNNVNFILVCLTSNVKQVYFKKQLYSYLFSLIFKTMSGFFLF
jgi:hypothetical protein